MLQLGAAHKARGHLEKTHPKKTEITEKPRSWQQMQRTFPQHRQGRQDQTPRVTSTQTGDAKTVAAPARDTRHAKNTKTSQIAYIGGFCPNPLPRA